MNNKLEQWYLRAEEAKNVVCFLGFIVREMARSTWQYRKKWHPDYINSPKAVAKGTAVYYEDLWLWQKILGRL